MESLFMGCVRGLFERERDDESRALALRAFCHNGSAVPISNFPAHREADAGAFVFAARVQALKDHEDLLGEARVETDAVVAHADLADFLTRR